MERSIDLKILGAALLIFLWKDIGWVLIVPLEGTINSNKAAGERIGALSVVASDRSGLREELGVYLRSNATVFVTQSADREQLETALFA
jgi:hypothetical protein